MKTRERIKLLTAVSFAVFVLAIYCIWGYIHERTRLLAQIDEKLYAAAVAVPFVLEDDFHDRAVGEHSISSAEDNRNIDNLSKLNDRLGIKFLYTVIRDHNGDYRLTSSSAPKDELEHGDEVRYYTAYPDVSVTLKQSFEESHINFSRRNEPYHALYVPVFSDRWGTYRSIFVPIRTPSGHTYVVGADLDISYVTARLRNNTLKTILSFVIFTLAILPIIYAYIQALKQKNREYQQVHQLYLDQSKRSITDPLTRLYNRFKLDEELETAFSLFQNYNRTFALIMTDLDYFKAINDRYGHQVGDTVLQSIATLLKESSRSADVVGRWGGEEFMIICRDADSNGAFHLAEKLRTEIASYARKHEYSLTASFGVAEPQTQQSLPQLLQSVDEALYAAKRAGRNQTVKASDDLRATPLFDTDE
ncbi:GGDEF domain-containing protein [Desulfuromonas acetoxidans]|uniref:diguanylate cyclase n=1 Tax=Desulfuromonas acetoxidans (strain DSM 684 / 11070) TaxID=281689 RepID=Q1K3D5_DESA6|nr:diguanylate cyclase [Desulfuromonas acetoxidans DSM 684]MBF0645151.1 GGDEF domain-containing protein [Desulfuromonas acetoxidans]NVD24045.1 GGDEF domain-containing protein [Desulfuromonas acetoxidans]NVE16341.1 GGDEF domain-containing protein [Desulfuromonas acetoxidans]